VRVARFYQQCSRDNQMELQTTVVRLCLARTEKQVTCFICDICICIQTGNKKPQKTEKNRLLTACWQTLDNSLDIGRPMSFDMFVFSDRTCSCCFFSSDNCDVLSYFIV